MVPSGWSAKHLVDITHWSSGGTPSKSNPAFWNGEIPWISAASMRGHYYSDSELKITKSAASKGAKMAPSNALLLLVRGSMLWNKIPVGIATRKVSFNQDVKCLIPDVAQINAKFLLYWFLTNENRLMNMVTGTGIGAGKLDTADLQNLDVFLPPLPEQRKIALILSTWDKAIATTEKLIESSKQQKKALMQQLLTGTKRLINPDTKKAFEGNWKQVSFGEIAQISSKKHNPRKSEKSFPCVELEHISQNSGKILGTTQSQQLASIKNHFDVGDVLFGKLRPYLRKFSLPNFPGVCSTEIWVLKAQEKVSPEYLYQFIQTNTFIAEANKSAGSKMPRADWKVVSELALKIPPNEEQQRIAIVFITADKEIEILDGKLSHFKQEKKALMQQLLTGKRRVKVEKELEITS